MNSRSLTTRELAAALGITTHAIHAALCRQGHYFGLRPTKLPNRYLRWPADSVARLTGEAASAATQE